MPRFRTPYLTASLGLIMAACSGNSASPPGQSSAAARPAADAAHSAERVLNIYNWTDFIEPTLITDFEKEFGIKVNYDVYETNEIMEVKLLSGHTNYDIVVPGSAFFERDRKAGLYQKLDKRLLPNLGNLDPGAVQATAILDPGNLYGVDYTWLVTVGIGYDVAKIKSRIPDVPLDSWRVMFDPQVLAKLKSCGISVLDSPEDVASAALAYLGKDINSESLEDLQAVEKVLLPIRPYLRYVDSTQYFSDLANGEICLALGWAGDVATSGHRAQEAGKTVTIDYFIPKEGSLSIADVLAIPADAPHPKNAHLFINYLLRPEVAARNVMTTTYASGVAGSVALVNEAMRNDSAVYPSPQARAHLVPARAKSQEYTRALVRLWTRFKTGQ